MFEHSAIGIALTDGSGRFVQVNAKWCEMIRCTESEVLALTDVVLVLDADGRYVKIAATSPELLYRPPEILLGRTLREVFPAERAAEFERVVRHSIASGERVRFEYAVEIAGERRWFTGSASPLQGLPLVVWVARDVTAERGARSAASFARSAPLCR